MEGPCDAIDHFADCRHPARFHPDRRRHRAGRGSRRSRPGQEGVRKMPGLPFARSRQEQGGTESAWVERPCFGHRGRLQLLRCDEERAPDLGPRNARQIPHQAEGRGARHQDELRRPAQGKGPRGPDLLSAAGGRVSAVSEGGSARILGILVAGVAALTVAFGEAAFAQSAPLHVPVVYLKETIEEPLPLSLVEPVAEDKGLAGAKLAIGDNNTTGKFLKQEFELVEKTVPAGGDLKAAAAELAAAGQKLVIADLTAP